LTRIRIDKAARPERHPKDPDRPKFLIVHEALKKGKLQGFVCDTIITLEGIQNKDRAAVFGSTTLSVDKKEADNSVVLKMQAVQPARHPLPDENVRRLRAALAVGVRVLSAPRIASPRIEDPNKTIYAQEDAAQLGERINRFHDAGRAINDRDYGTEPAKHVAERIAKRFGVQEPWYKSLARADANEEKEFARAIREWADSDTVAAHIAYQSEILCTGDQGRSGNSIFDETNRAWLTVTYGVHFATITELAAMICPQPKK
jgi:hypothetical protein